MNDDDNNNNNNDAADGTAGAAGATGAAGAFVNDTNPWVGGGGDDPRTPAAWGPQPPNAMRPPPLLSLNNNNEILWRERERRQRTVRAFMMFLFLMLILEDDPNQQPPPRPGERDPRLRGATARNRKTTPPSPSFPGGLMTLNETVWRSRRDQDARLQMLWRGHDRAERLAQRNGGVEVQDDVDAWARDQVTTALLLRQQRQSSSFTAQQQPSSLPAQQQQQQQQIPPVKDDDEREQTENSLVWHYPWNITGLFWGQWERQDDGPSPADDDDATRWLTDFAQTRRTRSNDDESHPAAVTDGDATQRNLTSPASAVEDTMQTLLRHRQRPAGVYFLSEPVRVRDDHNLTSWDMDRTVVDGRTGRLFSPAAADTAAAAENPFWKIQQREQQRRRQHAGGAALPLRQDLGRVALRLYARAVPGMMELSVVDGSVKLLDRSSHIVALGGNGVGDDVVIRVRGVLFHRVGILSLVSASAPVTHAALVMQEQSSQQQKQQESPTATDSNRDASDAAASEDAAMEKRNARRRLSQVDWNRNDATTNTDAIQRVRDDVWTVHGDRLQSWVDANHRRLQQEEEEEGDDGADGQDGTRKRRRRAAETTTTATSTITTNNNKTGTSKQLPPDWSDVVIPFPYVMDDADETLRQSRTPASRRFAPQERLLESNAAHCQFEMEFAVQAEEWTVGEWRKLIRRKMAEKERLKPGSELQHLAANTANHIGHTEQDGVGQSATEPYNSRHWPSRPQQQPHRRGRRPPPQDEALVMVINGTIRSDNCHFVAHVNATALRTNWEVTTNRAMNYSFYMMLVCLTQIIVLLRQLLHSQSQSAATRVSIVSVGWQTVIDGLLCLGHIYQSLAMNNLFTPFASVAFFKLLIFCVIEMKYMAIIISAHNSANGGVTTDVLRRQVALLHLRYYVALFGSLIMMFYAGDTLWRRLFFLTLYSFWVPQIVFNMITQARTPLHKHYIYGMSLSRLVAPLYVFCVKNNFLREVYPDVPHDPTLGNLLILWVGIQAAVLMAQSKYGARFMIPPCFLPPKFDYSRPIPASMLPPGALDMHTDPMEDETRGGGVPTPTSAEHKKDEGPDEILLTNTSDRHTTSMTTTRMRRAASNNNHSPAVISGTTAEAAATTSTRPQAPKQQQQHHRPTLDCCICYDAIDIRDRRGYMLAPCDHLFHRSCLVQWMEVKMECPICRSELPSL